MHEKERREVGTGKKDRNGCQSKCLDTNKARSKYSKHDNTSPSNRTKPGRPTETKEQTHTQTKERETHTHTQKKKRKKLDRQIDGHGCTDAHFRRLSRCIQ